MIYVANWKCNAQLTQITAFVRQFPKVIEPKLNVDCEVVICPSLPYFNFLSPIMNHISLGSQDVSHHSLGNLTGGVTADMLSELGVQYIIIGHSERRSLFTEYDDILAKKLEFAKKAGLRIIFCIGEDAECRAQNLHFEFLHKQLEILNDYPDVLIAYEPIWAIGSGVAATHAQVSEIFDSLIDHIPNGSKLIYGGSVNPDNVSELKNIPNLSGFLVGNASVDVESFSKIIAG